MTTALKRTGSELVLVRISHEAIYPCIYVLTPAPSGPRSSPFSAVDMPRAGLPHGAAIVTDEIPRLIPIQPKPPEVAGCLVRDHWEGDTVKGNINPSAVGALVKRFTLFVLLAKINGTTA